MSNTNNAKYTAMKKQGNLSRHHKKCKSNGGGGDRRNLSFVPRKAHTHWHALFYNLEAPSIAKIINQTWLDPEWELVARRRT